MPKWFNDAESKFIFLFFLSRPIASLSNLFMWPCLVYFTDIMLFDLSKYMWSTRTQTPVNTLLHCITARNVSGSSPVAIIWKIMWTTELYSSTPSCPYAKPFNKRLNSIFTTRKQMTMHWDFKTRFRVLLVFHLISGFTGQTDCNNCVALVRNCHFKGQISLIQTQGFFTVVQV